MGGGKGFTVDFDRIRGGEARRAVERGDSLLFEAAFGALGDGVGEGMLEAHQVCPVDAEFAGDTAASHAARPVHQLRATDQHLLGIAAPIGAGTAVGAGVHDGNRPSGGTAGVRDCTSGGSGTDDDEVEVLRHRYSVAGWRFGGNKAFWRGRARKA